MDGDEVGDSGGAESETMTATATATTATAEAATATAAVSATDAIVRRRLYVSHFLSTWNSRSFEFGATLFLAAAFPGSLLQVSVYAIARSGAAILFAPAVGRYIDTGGRLDVVRTSIVAQRGSTALSCILFFLLVAGRHAFRHFRHLILAGLCLLACVEKLASVLNLVAVERDWVVVIAGDDQRLLQALNAQMRRIDLFCKLVGPLAIALVDGLSSQIAIAVTLGVNLVCVPLEYITIARVYRSVPNLAGLRGSHVHAEIRSSDEPETETAAESGHINQNHHRNSGGDHQGDRHEEHVDESTPLQPQPPASPPSRSCFTGLSSCMSATVSRVLQQACIYAGSPVFVPSLSLSLLYLNVLSFNGQTVTYLLSAGFTSWHVGLLRLVSITVELSATWLAPLVARRIGPVRAGIWFLSWEIMCLALATAYFFPHSGRGVVGDGDRAYGTIARHGVPNAANAIAAQTGEKPFLTADGIVSRAVVAISSSGRDLGSAVGSTSVSESTRAALVLVTGIVLSRLGLWGFDLSAQVIVQEGVCPSNRGAFSTAEAALQNAFEMIAFATTAVWSRPDRFRYPVLISVGAVGLAGILYASFVRRRRGHLLHLPCGVVGTGAAGKWRSSVNVGDRVLRPADGETGSA